MIDDRLLIIENFLSLDICAYLESKVQNDEPLTVLRVEQAEFEIANLMRTIGHRITEELSVFYRTNMKVETLVVTAKRDGAGDEMHTDAMRRTPDIFADNTGPLVPGKFWVQNHSPNRVTVGLIALNNDYDYQRGGQLMFPDRGITINPTAGRLVAFPSNEKWEHMVIPVTRSISRCTLACWLVDDA